MANRSYLFATDLVPTPGVWPAQGRMVGISEWNYDIPPAFRLMLTGNPRKAISSIWEVQEEIAVVGDYEAGVERLLSELGRHAGAEMEALREEARAFLMDPANRRKFLVLECGEIFEMEEGSKDEQTGRLIAEIEALRAEPATETERPRRRGVLGRLFGIERREARAMPVDWEAYGLGNWSNVLYFEPRGASGGESRGA